MRTLQIIAWACLLTAGTEARAQRWMDADVNNDRVLDLKDVTSIVNTMAGDVTHLATADVNKDGVIDIADIVAQINVMKMPNASVEKGICPDRYHPHVVDIGSAGKWSCCNMGGDAPWEMGGRCAWGDTEIHLGRYYFDWENYPYRDESGGWGAVKNIGDDIAQTKYDVASVVWGETWCMPNDEQLRTLLDLPFEWTTLEGTSVRKIKAPNGNVLYMNADEGFTTYYTSQYKTDSLWGYYNNYGKWIEDWRYETGYVTYGIAPWFDPIQTHTDYSYSKQWNSAPYYGSYVRPIVCVPKPLPDEAVLKGYCPDNNHPHVIDLSAGGKWACCNVGASAPWERGGYYCWGGTKELSFYGATPENETACIWGTFEDGSDWWGYKWEMWNEDAVLRATYDVARVKWGGSWHMPTMTYFERLNDSSIRKEKTKLNGTPGLKITASNGKCIFMPYCGKKSEASFYYDMYTPMEYWTATSVTDYQGMILEPNAAASHHNYWYDPVEGDSPEDANTDFAQVHQARGVGLPVRAVQ